MADYDPFAEDSADAVAPAPEPATPGWDPFADAQNAGTGVSWSDWGNYLKAGVFDTMKMGAGVAQYVTGGDETGFPARLREDLNQHITDTEQEMSPAARKAGGANWLPTPGPDNDVWDSGVSMGSAITAQSLRSMPSMVASVVPAAFAGPLGMVVAGLETGGDVANNIREGILKMPEEQLEKSDLYRGLVEMGMDKAEAREELIKQTQGYAPVLMGAFSALTSSQGAEGIAAHMTKGGIRQGILKEGVQEGAENLFQSTIEDSALANQHLIDGVDWMKALHQSVNGIVVGGVMGGTVGAVTGGEEPEAKPAKPAKPTVEVTEDGVGADEKAAMAAGATAAVEAKTGPETEGAATESAPAPGTVPSPPPSVQPTTPETVADGDEEDESAIPEDTEGLPDEVTPAPGAAPEAPATPAPGSQEAVDTALADVNEAITSAAELMDPDQLAALASPTANAKPSSPTPPAPGVSAGPVPGPGGGDRGGLSGRDPVGPVQQPAVADQGPQPSFDEGLFGALPEQRAPGAPADQVASVGEPEGLGPLEGQGTFDWDAALAEPSTPGASGASGAAGPEAQFREVASQEPAAAVTGRTKAEVIRAKSLERSAAPETTPVTEQVTPPVEAQPKPRTGRVIPSQDKASEEAAKQAWVQSPQVRTEGDAAAFVHDNEAALRDLAAKRAAEPNALPFWSDLHAGFTALSELGRGHKRNPKKYQEARAKIDAAREAGLKHFTDQKIAAEENADVDAAPETKRTAKKQAEVDATEAARQGKIAAIKDILKNHPWEKAEDRALHGLKAGKDAILTRVGKILAAAKAAGIEVPDRANKQMSLHEKALVEYKRVFNKLQSGRFGPESAAEFAAFDLAARGDALEDFWKTTQIEQNAQGSGGDSSSNAFSGEGQDELSQQDRANADQARDEAERLEQEAYEAARRRKAGEAATGEAKTADDKYAQMAEERGVRLPTAEEKREQIEKKIDKVSALAERGATEGERTAAQARLAALKAKRNDPTAGDAIVTAGRDMTGKVQVEKKRKFDIPKNGVKLRVTDLTPEEEAEFDRILAQMSGGQGWTLSQAYDSLSPAERAALEEFKAANGYDDAQIGDYIEQAISIVEGTPELVTQLGNSAQIARRVLRHMAYTFKPISSGNFNGILRQFDFTNPTFARVKDIYTALRSSLMSRIGKTEVHVLSYDDFIDADLGQILSTAAATGRATPPPLGFYDQSSGKIFIRDDVSASVERSGYVLLHEGAHAATAIAIESNPELKAKFEKLFDYVKNELMDMDPEWAEKLYGLTNIHEMVAEGFSNPTFQEAMAYIPLPPRMAKELGLPGWIQTARSAWHAFVQMVKTSLGIPEAHVSALDALMQLNDEIDHLRAGPVGVPTALGGRGVQTHYLRGNDALNAARDRGAGASTAIKRVGRKLMTLDQIRQNIAGLFMKGGVDQGQRYIEEMQKIGPRRDALGQLPTRLALKWEAWARKNPQMAATMADIAERATMLNVSLVGSNTHLKATDHQAHEGLKTLQAEFARLSPDAKALYQEMTAFYRKAENDLTSQTIRNWLDLEPGLSAQQKQDILTRALAGKLTDADKKVMNDETFKAIGQARSLLVKGDYFPLMRHGEIVVRTKSALTNLHGGTMVPGSDDTVEFRAGTEADADKASSVFEKNTDLIVNSKAKTYYVKGTNTRIKSEDALKNHLPSGVKPVDETIYYDLQTNKRIPAHEALQPGSVEGVDYRKGTRRTYEDAAGNKLTKADVLAKIVDVAYRVRVQREGFYSFETNTQAHRFIRENRKAFESIDDEPMQRADIGVRRDLQSTQLSGLMSSIAARRDIDPHTKSLAQGLVREAAIRMMSGNRIQKNALYRQNVYGASKSLSRNLLRYGHTWSSAMARAEHMPVAREFFQGMREAQRGVFDKQTGARSDYLKELELRLQQDDDMRGPNPAVKTLMQLSYLDKLFSPAYSVINAMQPWMVSYPVLAGKFGGARAALELSKAFVAIGAHRAWQSGLANTGRAGAQFRNLGLDTTDVGNAIRRRFNGNPEMKALFDLLFERGGMADAAGLEMSRDMIEGRGFVGENLGKFARVASQLPSAVEAINRAATAVAAYNLARKGGMSAAQAREYAFDAVQNTQGDYSEQNSPRFMKNPWLRPAMQFRKYAQMITYLLFDMTRRAFGKNPSRADRIAAMKSLGMVMTTQILMAGALSLPGIEILKAGAMFAAIFGFGKGWDDLEDKLRGWVAASIGKRWEEMIDRGILTRALGLDVSSRLSLSDIWLFGEPKDAKRDSVQSYFFQLAFGAPGSLAMDWLEGLTAAGHFEWGKAAEKLVPAKFLVDWMKASQAPDVATGLTNAVGFKTGAQAEKAEETSRKIREHAAAKDAKNALYAAYRDAGTAGERAKVMSRIRAYNRTAKPGQRVYVKSIDRERRKELSQ